MEWKHVEDAVAEGEQHAKVGVAVQAPGGERWERNGDYPSPAASTVKIPIMIEIFRKIERGEISLGDTRALTAADKTDGSGVLLHLHEGLPTTIDDLLYLMISISDNTATNMLIDVAGLEQVNQTMQELGMTNSRLSRPMLGRPAGEGDPPENLAAANDYVTCVDAILENTAASAESCAAIVDLLEKQQNTHRIGRWVPDTDDYRWGSKTGSLNGVCNDVGFITGPAGTVLVAVYLSELDDPVTGERIIADIAKAAMLDCGLL